MNALAWTDAVTLAEAIRRREISAVELMRACYAQIEALNPSFNALVNVLPRREAVRLAKIADRQVSSGAPTGPLHGLPMAAKDNIDVIGFPTTAGFEPFAGRVARRDSLLAARQRQAGAIFIAKSNMPEFGLGSHTFNRLFGLTRNPWDPARTAGGSSGGAAVALATGMVPLADGSDMGGSLRNPAAFCNVVGLRPSLGRIPDPEACGWFVRLTTHGPLARTVRDAALLLSVQAGPDPADPLSLEAPAGAFADLDAAELAGLRIAWSADLGHIPVDPTIAATVEVAAGTFGTLGCSVQPDAPDLRGAMGVFQVLRGAALAMRGRALDLEQPDWRRHAKATAIWNVDQGLALTATDLISAEQQRATLYRTVVQFFARYDALLLPATQVLPFPVDCEWVRSINGIEQTIYIDWMAICCVISVLGLPSISVPGGFTAEGLPIGLQIVGPPRADTRVLQIARAFEAATGFGNRRPPGKRG
jgi:amidase